MAVLLRRNDALTTPLHSKYALLDLDSLITSG